MIIFNKNTSFSDLTSGGIAQQCMDFHTGTPEFWYAMVETRFVCSTKNSFGDC